MHLEKENLKTFLRLLEKPLYFLDFETINPAIPLYDGTSPYGKIPFQFSCHIQKGANLAQEEYLHDGFSDPRLTLIKALIKTLGKKGSIVAYNANFEISVIKGLANQFPKYQKELMALTERFVDLLMPFRSRHIYHPDMKGSASLKSVIPVFEPGLNYEQLEIKDGGGASEVYKAICKGSIEGIEKDKMMEALREYCMLDTLAMVKLVEVLENLTKERK
jgi:hypothetical protein